MVLGVGKVSCLERCPQFKSVLIERERGSIHKPTLTSRLLLWRGWSPSSSLQSPHKACWRRHGNHPQPNTAATSLASSTYEKIHSQNFRVTQSKFDHNPSKFRPIHQTFDQIFLARKNFLYVPEYSWVVFLLEYASLSSDDDPVPLSLLLEVCGVAGPVEGEKEGAIGHVVTLDLQ